MNKSLLRSSKTLLGLGLGAVLSISLAQAATYPAPNKRLKVIVPWDAGGGVDLSMRFIQKGLEEALGIPVDIENMPGGGSQAGLSRCALAKPDGYTLCATALPSTSMTYLLPERKAPYKRTSFVPVGTYAIESGSLIVAKDSPFKTVEEIIEAAKNSPGGIRVGNAGRNTNAHIDLLQLEKEADVEFASVFFSGGPTGITALIGGHVDALSSTASNYMGQYKTGDIRVLGIMSDEPSDLLPGVPIFASQGLNLNQFTTRTLAFQAGVDAEKVAVVESALEQVIKNPEIEKKLAGLGSQIRWMSAEQTEAFWTQLDQDLFDLIAQGDAQ